MNNFYLVYMVIYLAALAMAVYLCAKNLKSFVLFHKKYWLFLSKPWKMVTFIIATIFMVVVAPYSGDYTWDYWDALFMALLTYITAPWVVGTFYKFKTHKASIQQACVATCMWLFSASWSYDLYLLWRDGHYPETWLANLVLSSLLYWCGGLFWNLDWQPEKGVFFSFVLDDWPKVSKENVFEKIIRKGLIYILFCILLLGMVIYSAHVTNN